MTGLTGVLIYSIIGERGAETTWRLNREVGDFEGLDFFLGVERLGISAEFSFRSYKWNLRRGLPGRRATSSNAGESLVSAPAGGGYLD